MYQSCLSKLKLNQKKKKRLIVKETFINDLKEGDKMNPDFRISS